MRYTRKSTISAHLTFLLECLSLLSEVSCLALISKYTQLEGIFSLAPKDNQKHK